MQPHMLNTSIEIITVNFYPHNSTQWVIVCNNYFKPINKDSCFT